MLSMHAWGLVRVRRPPRGPCRTCWEGGCARQGSRSTAYPCQPAAAWRTGPVILLPATPLSPGQTALSPRGRQTPGCRVIGPFKSKLSAAGNKTLPLTGAL